MIDGRKFEVYLIRHLDSGMGYVGCTHMGLAQRWRRHLIAMRKYHPHPLYVAMREFGEEAFEISLLVGNIGNRSEGCQIEKHQMLRLGTISPNGFNQDGTPKAPRIRKVRMAAKKEDRVQIVMPRAEIDALDAWRREAGYTRSAAIRAAVRTFTEEPPPQKATASA